jgi:histidyl-tRNA synthetase
VAKSLQSVKGMNDLLPDSTPYWQQVESALRRIAQQYSYAEIRTPILEKTELFVQAIGEQTDIVEKEMFAFEDAGGEHVCMRPENTAAVVRAGVQHGLFHNAQARLWYLGLMFRRERPQKGRYRQFYQFGMEAFGWRDASVDAEIIIAGKRIWSDLGVQDVSLSLNTLGSDKTREDYKAALLDYLSKHFDELDADSQRRLTKNPLRILDSKNETTQSILVNAPTISDYLEPEDKTHFTELQNLLNAAGVEYVIDAALVRGLDYYTSTVFEWKTTRLGAQNTVCAGGRYDKLVEGRGGKPTPAVGFAMGIERLIELLLEEGNLQSHAKLDAYIIALDASAVSSAQQLSESCRNVGLNVAQGHGHAKLKSQLKKADSSGAEIAVILGEQELAHHQGQVKYLRQNRESEMITLDKISDVIQLHVNSAH